MFRLFFTVFVYFHLLFCTYVTFSSFPLYFSCISYVWVCTLHCCTLHWIAMFVVNTFYHWINNPRHDIFRHMYSIFWVENWIFYIIPFKLVYFHLRFYTLSCWTMHWIAMFEVIISKHLTNDLSHDIYFVLLEANTVWIFR